MKKLVCEMCGGADLVKQDGVFVCQNCGTKYSVEEAKKMMMEGSVSIEGTVAVEGIVKVDQSDDLKNLYILARRAKDAKNSENACKYYNEIVIKDPNSWEANFYLVYYHALNCKKGQIGVEVYNVTNCLKSTIKLLVESLGTGEEAQKFIAEIKKDLAEMAGLMIYCARDISKYDYIGKILRMQEMLGTCLAEYPELQQQAVEAWKQLITTYVDDVKFGKPNLENVSLYGYSPEYAVQLIYEIDPTYEDPFGVAKELRKNEKFITCPKCGKVFRERESACPECGCTKQEIEQIEEERRIQAEKEAEERRIQAEKEAEERRIQAEKEAEERRIKAEQEAAEQAARRKEWWQKNKTKVFVGIFIFIGAIIAAIFVVKHQAKAKQEKANIMAMKALDSADSCMRVNNFDRAEEYYRLALEYANDEFLVQKCCICLTELDAERESYQYRHKKTKVNRTNTTLTNAELWEDFESAYIRYYGITSLNESTYSVAKKNIQNFLYAGKKEGADISRILTEYSSDWKWLGDYIQEVNGTQITSEIRWRFSVVAFFLANEGDSRYNVDFSWAGEPEAWRSAYQDAQ